MAVREELRRQLQIGCALVASAWRESHCFTVHTADGDGHCFFHADYMSRTKVTVEPLAEEIHNSRCMVAGALDSFKTNSARHIISKLSCSPEAARTLTSESEILCSARAIMHRKVDCSRPCDSSE